MTESVISFLLDYTERIPDVVKVTNDILRSSNRSEVYEKEPRYNKTSL